MTARRVRIIINGQQREFVERVRRDHDPDASIDDMVRRALEELGGEWLAEPSAKPT